jgi:Holliday junction resolvase RusA-like endonuclease
MKTYTFTVRGEPKALKRHRTFFKNGVRINVDPSKGDKADFIAQIIQNAPKDQIRGAIEINMAFYFLRPKSHFGTGKNTERIKESAPAYKTTTPDLDNLIKFVLDAMNGIVFYDDSQITSLTAGKYYDRNCAKTCIEIISKED